MIMGWHYMKFTSHRVVSVVTLICPAGTSAAQEEIFIAGMRGVHLCLSFHPVQMIKFAVRKGVELFSLVPVLNLRI